MTDSKEDLDDDVDLGLLGNLSALHIGSLQQSHPGLVNLFRPMDPAALAATFAGLLTKPELQSNCIRIEALIYLALTTAKGSRAPAERLIGKAFDKIGEGSPGHMEDPAEDVFVSCIATPRGNFRILEGVWEAGGFYTQRFINILETMPRREDYDQFRDSVYSLLTLSDEICRRAGLSRNQLGEEVPVKRLPKHMARDCAALGEVVTFSKADLRALNIDPMLISHFVFEPTWTTKLLSETINHTTLERYPILADQGAYYFVLPTAISATIRRFVIERMDKNGLRDAFINTLTDEYQTLFSNTPILGHGTGTDIAFQRVRDGVFAAASAQIDVGRFMNLIFVVDTLDGVETTGLGMAKVRSPNAVKRIEELVAMAEDHAASHANYVGGFSLVISCGIGRGLMTVYTRPRTNSWKVEFLSVHDLFTLSWLEEFQPLSLWRIFTAQAILKEIGVDIMNVNGLVNLVGWVRMNDSHMAPQGRLPDHFVRGDGTGAMLVIDQAALRTVRHDVAATFDPHMELGPQGSWIEVRKEGRSPHREDLERPLYAVFERPADGAGIPSLYVSPQRTWWCYIKFNKGIAGATKYDRWKMCREWLGRTVPVVESLVSSHLPGPVVWQVTIEGDFNDSREDINPNLSFEDARSNVVVEVDDARSTISTILRPNFEQTIFNVINIAERALVDGLVEGIFRLAGEPQGPSDRAIVVNQIVPDTTARFSHAFMVRSFRDFMAWKMPSEPIFADSMEDATFRLGLAWKVRGREKSSVIDGKQECTSFLNSLVTVIEDDLCADLRCFDRQMVLTAVLSNHEVAAKDSERWLKTAAAVLSLHKDKDATMEVMAEHNFKLNSVFQQCRVLVEMAVCECPIEGGRPVGPLDLSRLMVKAGATTMFGGWSDAIRWDAMQPRIKVAALGDVYAKQGFLDKIILPFAKVTHKASVTDAVETYADNLEEMLPNPGVGDRLSAEFIAAWNEQAGATIDETRLFVDYIEDIATKKEEIVVAIRKSDLHNIVVDGKTLSQEKAAAVYEFLVLRARDHWRDIPEGYSGRDIHPWRFRRHLSILRKPLLEVTREPDPLVIVAPGLMRDALGYMLGGYYRGDFHRDQLKPKMKAWAGKESDRRGNAFTEEVAERLRELGWQVKTQVKITALLQTGFDLDYGDVDVLAWKGSQPRVLIMECKDVQFRKTHGEIAEQLYDFRGVEGSDGKPDHLLRHLRRVDLIRNHLQDVGRHIKVTQLRDVESHLTFKNPVPVAFALDHLRTRVAVHTFDALEKI